MDFWLGLDWNWTYSASASLSCICDPGIENNQEKSLICQRKEDILPLFAHRSLNIDTRIENTNIDTAYRFEREEGRILVVTHATDP